MKALIVTISLIGLIATLSAVASAGQKPAARATDDAAIRKIIIRVQDAWNVGDAKAFGAQFAEDADYVIINGMRIKGRAAIDAGHAHIFATIYKGSRNVANIQSVRFIRDDVAVAHVDWHLKYSDNGAAREGRAIASFVFVKEKGEWSIGSFQNTPIAPPR